MHGEQCHCTGRAFDARLPDTYSDDEHTSGAPWFLCGGHNPFARAPHPRLAVSTEREVTVTSNNPMTAWQQQALAGFREQQEAYLEAVAAWRKAFPGSPTAGAVPTPPTAPPMDSAVSPQDVVDANRAFMEAMLKQQQDFLEKLTRTLNSNS
jgi:hypothetical protein